MTQTLPIAVIGAGLAGCELTYQLLKIGLNVDLFEMRPHKMTPAHHSEHFAELVCSNSLKSTELNNAHGLLKKEMEIADSLIVKAALASALPAGSALAVDRDAFSTYIEKELNHHPGLRTIREEVSSVRELLAKYDQVVIATGPLTSDLLAEEITALLKSDDLYFYDAIAPVIFTESIDFQIAFKASRYGKGEDDYINCPFTKGEYEAFVDALLMGEKVALREFEKPKYFEGCLPIEVLAERGRDTLAFGPMKPVGLVDPRTQRQPYAVLQLRQENQSGTLYNLVGCQTKLTWPEQKKIFRKIPGLQNCQFARMGSIHRNTYINAPLHLDSSMALRSNPKIHFAGQITGVEGYSESAASGLWVALSLIARLRGKEALVPNPTTMIGALIHYLNTANPANFQPMNSNFGLLTPLSGSRINKKDKKQKQAEMALSSWKRQFEEIFR